MPITAARGYGAGVSFDVHTLYFAGVVLAVLQVIGLLPLCILNRRMPGIRHWMASNVLYAVAIILFVQQARFPHRELTFLLPSFCWTLAAIAFYSGCCLFTGRKIHTLLVGCVSATLFGVYVYFLYYSPDLQLGVQGRVRTGALQAGFLYVMTAVVLLRERRKELRVVSWIVGLVLSVYAVAMAHRFLTWGAGNPRTAWITGRDIDNVMMGVFVIVASYLWMMWIILLIHQYQRRELAQSMEARHRAEEELLLARNEIERQKALQLRKTMARDLHDGIGGITATLAMLASLGREEEGEERERLLEHIETIAVEGNQEVRTLMGSLENGIVGWQEWLADLRNYALKALGASSVNLEWEVSGPVPGHPILDTAAAISLKRAVKEAIHNLARHAEASSAVLTMAFEDSMLSILIRDDGKGFTEGRAGGRGLKNMAMRISELNGVCDISRGGKGTLINFQVPLPLEINSSGFPAA